MSQLRPRVIATGTRGDGADGDETPRAANPVNVEDDKEEKEDSDMESEVGEQIKIKRAMTPMRPSQKEIEEHELTHVNYRSWCIHCNKGKARNTPHRRQTEEEDPLTSKPIVSIDYFYMETDYKDKRAGQYRAETEGKRPILAVCDSRTRAIFAHDMKEKGANEDTLKQLEDDIKNLGYEGISIIIKGDQEPSIMAIQEALSRRRNDGQIVLENSPVGESSSNGRVERAIQSIQGQVRTIKDQVEAIIGAVIPRNSNTFKWLVEWSATTITRFKVNSNGKTPYHMIKGRQSNAQIASFGEKILYMPPKSVKTARSKFDVKLEDGVFLGMNMRTDEIKIGTKLGVVKARTIKRLCVEERWNAEALRDIRGEPIQPVPGVSGEHIPINIRSDGKGADKEDQDIDEEQEDKEITGEVNVPREPENKVRKMRVRKQDVEKYGFTQGCPGCRKLSIPGSTGHVVHNDECRQRVQKEMEADEEGKLRLAHDKERQARKQDEIFEREAMKVDEIKEAEQIHQGQVEDIRQKSGDDKVDGMDEDAAEIDGKGNEVMENCDEMEGANDDDDGAMEQDKEELEEAPAKKHDVRVPEIPRSDAVKRRAETELDGSTGGKYMAQIEDDLRMNGKGDLMSFMMMKRADVAEVYSPERVVKVAREEGLRAGFSLDITNTDERGVPWDFTKVERRNAAIRRILEEEPLFVIGSPLCTEWSIMQNANKHKWTQEERDKRLNEARVHLEFMCKIYLIRAKNNRYFIHEHPASASSWAERCIVDVQRRTRSQIVVGDMCRFGMTTTSGGKTGLAMKPTKFMTNSMMVAKRLGKRCLNRVLGMKDHEHVQLEGSRTKQAQKYPNELCRAI